MRRNLPWLMGVVIGVGIGTAGTYTVMNATANGESRACAITREWADKFIIAVKDEPGTQSQDAWLKDIEEMNGLLNVRDKACR